MIPQNSKNKIRLITWVVLIMYTIFNILIRPIHQDDGWYAANAYNLSNSLFYNNQFSSWDFGVPGVKEVGVGFIYSLIQLFFVSIFGPDVIYTKILIFCILIFSLILLQRLSRKIAQDFSILLPIIIFLNPIFTYHFYNRPELLSSTVGLLAIYIIINSDFLTRKWHILLYIIPWIMLDVHPISIFFVIGAFFWSLLKKKVQLKNIITGSLIGLFIYLIGNYFFHRSLGLFSPLIGLKPFKGDHYVPILESNFKDIVRIFIIRHKITLEIFIISLIPIFYKGFKKIKSILFILTNNIFFFNFSLFIITTSLFTEAVGNGFPLYSIISLMLLLFYVLRINNNITIKYKLLKFIPLFSLLIYLNFINYNILIKRIKYQISFNNDYYKISKIIPNNSKIAMRPTYAFALSQNHIKGEYFYYILFYMKEKNIGFRKALFEKRYDFIAIDEMDRNSMFGKLPIYWNNANPFYRNLPNLGIPLDEIDNMLRDGSLSKIYNFNEISHGNTIFYKVNRDILERNLLN
jgi:hypothetical protein